MAVETLRLLHWVRETGTSWFVMIVLLNADWQEEQACGDQTGLTLDDGRCMMLWTRPKELRPILLMKKEAR